MGILYSPHTFEHFKLCRRQVQIRLLQSHLQPHLINLSRLAGAAPLLLYSRKSFQFFFLSSPNLLGLSYLFLSNFVLDNTL